MIHFNFRGHHHISIRKIFITALFGVLLLQSFSSLVIILHSVNMYKNDLSVFRMNRVSDNLFSAVNNYGFERGRLNLALNNTGAVTDMEENNIFLQKRRAEGDKALLQALAAIDVTDNKKTAALVENIQMIRQKVLALRKEASRDIEEPLSKRNPALPEAWFGTMTGYIDSIDALLVYISYDISNTDGTISRYFSIKHHSLALRNTAGSEIALLSAPLSSATPLKPGMAGRIKELQTTTIVHFRELRSLCVPFRGTDVFSRFSELETYYFGDYAHYRDIIYPLALQGGPYPFPKKQFLKYGDDALYMIQNFMDAVVDQTEAYTIKRLSESSNVIIHHVLILSVTVILIGSIFLALDSKINVPLENLRSRVMQLAKRNTDVEIPYLDYKNEIGSMAQAVNVFKETMITLDTNVENLEKLSEERRVLIEELQQTLEEVKALRGIIPICSYCKSIRNDKGYYEKLEEYISSHSDADFSHTICPDCMKKHFPDFVDEEMS